jgi:16S rRNA (guanine966-N2)-methyltransferase
MLNKRSNSVRIIGGSLRGRAVSFSDLPGLRPTSDRIRETLFNWLMHDTQNAVVLDLFSGSGVLGIEALSRGARKVIFVEKSKAVLEQIESHLKAFKIGPERYELYCREATEFLSAIPKSSLFDLIFLDPPFRHGLLAQVLPRCEALLAPTGKVYVEHEQGLPQSEYLPQKLHVLKEKEAGEVIYLLLGKTLLT